MTIKKNPEAVVSALSPGETHSEQPAVLLQTAIAIAEYKEMNIPVRCLYDGGSQRSFIREEIVNALHLTIVGEETLNLHTFGSDAPKKVTQKRVKITLRNCHCPDKAIEMELLAVPNICSAVVSVPGEGVRREMKNRGLTIADDSSFVNDKTTKEISVLIGSDYYWKLVSGRTERLGESLVAIESLFGWSIQGPTSASLSVNIREIGVMKAITEEELISSNLRAFWELETLGISESKKLSDKDQEIVERVEKSVRFHGERYETILPWKQERERLGNNYQLASKRLKNLSRKFLYDPLLWEQYQGIISEYEQLGIIELADKGSLMNHETEVHYIPHHPVIRNDKATSKLRIVFDASSHEKGQPSLNDCLIHGPNLNPDLLHVLMRFRSHRIALMADIERAFLQISLSERERDYVRFLWPKKKPIGGEEIEIEHYRMTRVLFGVNSSPFLLASIIRQHLTKWETVYPEVCNLLKDNLYVDDFISGAENEEEALNINTRSREVMSAAGMNLRKWVTNSKKVKTQWEDSDVVLTPQVCVAKPNPSLFKVLGLSWNHESDNLTFDVTGLLQFLNNRESNKRNVLSASARVFDPVGFISPFLIRVKCLFQELWVRGLTWDEELPPDLCELWNQWSFELRKLQEISIPRWYYETSGEDPIAARQLHLFCDASEKAYAAVIYMRATTEANQVVISLVTSKTRVAPLKRLSLPRLELMAAVIGARLLQTTISALGKQAIDYICWTDSAIVLHWIQGQSRNWKPFVANRISEIQTMTNPQQWKHCSGKDNPADFPSRGISIENLLENEVWWKGPTWLANPDKFWPVSRLSSRISEDVQPELRTTVQLSCTLEETPEPLLEVKRYGSLSRLLRVTSWILRFIQNLKRNPQERRFGPLETEEMCEAETYWLRQTQRETFQIELQCLASGKSVPKESLLYSLNPVYDKGLARIGGRLQQSDLSYQEQHPVILPSKHKFTELLVKQKHEEVKHSGLNDTLIQLRENFWIPRGRQLVKGILQRCLVCRRYKAKRGVQSIAPLPTERTVQSPPFEVTGIDFAGPLYVKIGNHQEKIYVALFTCAVTRAVHLETVLNLGTESFILAFRRFVSRRGLCHHIYSDNAKTFKRADKEIQQLLRSLTKEEFTHFLRERKIKWSYIVERGAWWGGFWERMVRSMKLSLKKILGKGCLTHEEISTVLVEIEAVLNSRPLTFTMNDSNEPSPLTPSHFLVGHRLTSLPINRFSNPVTPSTRDVLTKRLRHRENVLNRFWKRWKHEYLMELRSAHDFTPKKPTKTIKVDDVVLLEEKMLPRQMWKLGRIVNVFPGRDGKIRACAVKLPGGTILRRPIQLLFPMELNE